MLRVVWELTDVTSSRGATQESFTIENFSTHVMDPLLAKGFPEGRKSHALRLHIHLGDFGFILSMRRNSFNENSLGSVLIRYTVLIWHNPASGGSTISRDLLQIVDSMMLMTY
jgi:hypothetical protein